MASNLALQYAAGIPAPACQAQQVRRNLVTKAQKSSITAMAAINPPAIHYSEEGSAFGSSVPRHLLTVSSKRNKSMVVGAYPDVTVDVEVKLIPGVPVHTEGVLRNYCGHPLQLDDKTLWAGSQSITIDKHIKEGETGSFKQFADSRGSVGALEYVFEGDQYKWIIAWSNAPHDLNKVYTVILELDADWIDIRQRLDTSGHDSIFNGREHNIPYSARLVIDEKSPTPTVYATIVKGLTFDSDSGSSHHDQTHIANQTNGTLQTEAGGAKQRVGANQLTVGATK